MSFVNYLRITIGGYAAEVTDIAELPVNISYSLEDSENFQNKKSAEAIDIEIPATLMNSVLANTYFNPSVEDMTAGSVFRNSQQAVIEANGHELVVGKAFLKEAAFSYKPISFTYNILGDNADWIVELGDKTLYDFLSNLNFSFDKTTIINSWAADGVNRIYRYVFAPVRYREAMGGYNSDGSPNNETMLPDYMRPSLFKYFIIEDAFKSIGYRVVSDFMDLEYFRRQTMPWIWTSFLESDSTQLEAHKFLAKSTEDKYFDTDDGTVNDYIDLDVSNDSTDGAFDNNGDYTYNSTTKEMIWTYNAQDFGPLVAGFSAQIFYEASVSGNASRIKMFIDWFINGVQQIRETVFEVHAGIIGTTRPTGIIEMFFVTPFPVALGDTVSAKIWLFEYKDKISINDVAHTKAGIVAFQLDFFRIPLGGSIDFSTFSGFQNFKFMDFIAGVIDEFDLSVNTDPINKVVYIEPTHSYRIGATIISPNNDGYFKDDYLDWEQKLDIAKTWKITNYSDTSREFTFAYKDDTNDGVLKLIQDRNTTKVANSKYVFPDRFQTGAKTRTNRFFAPTMHVPAPQWKDLGTGSNTGITTQLICIVPENVSNTSHSAADNVFTPKSCYYKGLIAGAGAWSFDNLVMQTYPYMFSVNYQDGGEADPILSYSDEYIGDVTKVIGYGLVKRFYWQRLAIMRNGQRCEGYFMLKNIDVAGQIHREFKSFLGNKWELINIKGFKPLVQDSTQVLLYKWSPISVDDFNATFPTVPSIQTGFLSGLLDIKYARLMCLVNDLPNQL